MGLNELILVGTGFVLARVLFLQYAAPVTLRRTGRKR